MEKEWETASRRSRARSCRSRLARDFSSSPYGTRSRTPMMRPWSRTIQRSQIRLARRSPLRKWRSAGKSRSLIKPVWTNRTRISTALQNHKSNLSSLWNQQSLNILRIYWNLKTNQSKFPSKRNDLRKNLSSLLTRNRSMLPSIRNSLKKNQRMIDQSKRLCKDT